MQPQRLVVPLFQRPYVWNQENQWEPLWNDVIRVAQRILDEPLRRQQPHFLGAVVLQQIQNPVGLMQQRTIIDGQQRLTTLQLLMDALQEQLIAAGAVTSAKRIEPLVENAEPFRTRPEDRFKVWPTNRDRPAFNAVMGADGAVVTELAKYETERIAEAYRYFTDQSKAWLAGAGPDNVSRRAEAVETVVRDYLQMVVIDLAADENAQEIFETLNARGAQLTAADLIKNFVFQRLLESGTDVEAAYEKYWKEFETGFWESEISVGRMRYPRSSIFLNHWLIARTGEEIVAREVFSRFKRFADFDSGLPMTTLLEQIARAARVYRGFTDTSAQKPGALDRLALFSYRTSVLESEAIKPLVLYLLDPELPSIPDQQLLKALDVIESWMVRRMLVRATTKSYTQVVAEIIKLIRSERLNAGELIETYFRAATSEARYWPDDEEIQEQLGTLQAYRVLGRGRLRMVLEAVEDHYRGWREGKDAFGGERVARGTLALEHIMPRKWAAHWQLGADTDEHTRDRLIHTIGNLTLLTGKLNSKMSNAAWAGPDGKRATLHLHDVFLLNREVLKQANDAWTDELIRVRSTQLAKAITEIWPVPAGHRSGFTAAVSKARKKIRVQDLINAGLLEPGMRLYPRSKTFADRVVTLLPDGRIDADGKVFSSVSEAAAAMRGSSTNGWWFFLVDPTSKRSLRAVRRDYIRDLFVDADDDEDDAEDEEA